ncbi:hypothetical protein GPECTOR_21g704 [Gonium pectorale]|uniref:Protein kinase domain-containing protein n=1 Tax=Gonium pectorale TaxID=33097 RepID=A0A150GI17_GONPE|nr:hypothetical protein GPECTOR_21g704 [Gonium pectorale]|eukprot:KXZ49478.1 hypothetical protein GPECTOR_21g704 [Gonium pectorale]
MALPPPRTAATGTLVSAWHAANARGASGGSELQAGPSGRGILGSAPMTPDQALARLTDKLSSSSHSSGRSSQQLQQLQHHNHKVEDRLPSVRGPIPGALTRSNNGKTRSLQGIVGAGADPTDSARPGGQRAGGGGGDGARDPKLHASPGSRPASLADTGADTPRAKTAHSSLQPDVLGKGAAAPDPEVPMDIDLAQLNLGQEIGRGGFGRVYAGTYQGTPVAVKMLLGASSALSELAALRLEVSILSRTNHENIMKVFGCNLSPPKPFIVAELLMCSLHDYIYHPQADTRTLLVVRLARGIAAALAYLHPAVLHRDLKPGNVLLSQEGSPKIADFGLARWKLKTLLSTQTLEAGSVPYLAPECFDPDNWHLTDRVDVYSMGVIMCEMLVRRPPWHGMSSMQVAWEVHVQCPAGLLRLIEACWDQDPKKRPSAAHVHGVLCELHDKLEADEAGQQ